MKLLMEFPYAFIGPKRMKKRPDYRFSTPAMRFFLKIYLISKKVLACFPDTPCNPDSRKQRFRGQPAARRDGFC
ncbi:hypothetical protein [Paenibacillus sp. JDR-2]|uniref:hypothetical protein n=1 Tax=Paenibacillus sp. (strain JDR-2) TaxID=324057 RepID=UPI001237384B|nr:hypothetical protein [Paenibacillus sp. JDR-2]